jgi:DNA-directed RNA polymerase subunit RPC12/RpoP
VPTLADYPDLVAQFDRKKNRPAKPETISYGSARKYWWRCPKGPDHAWETSPNARTQGENCPFCAGKRISVTNSLAARAPEVAAEWHPTKNRPRTPETTHAGTNRKAWWKCHHGHTWESVVSTRAIRGLGCPYCSHRRATLGNSLAVLGPELAAEWHPTRNGELLARQVLAKSNRKVWWKCPEGADHEWQASIVERGDSPSGRASCPFCGNRRLSETNLLAARYPEVAAQWHPTRNGKVTPRDVTYSAMRFAWWRCASGHEWRTRVHQRTQVGTRCPYCVGRLVTPERSLAAVSPEVAARWHPTKNGRLTPADVLPASMRRVWWKCPEGSDHVWQSTVANRSALGPSSCPFCAGKRVSKTNALSICFPKVAQQWHPTKNGTLTPREVTAGTTRRVWWRCVSGHEWQTKVLERTRKGYGCPHCRRHEQAAATTGKRRRGVVLAGYEGARKGPVRRVG